MGNRTPHFMQCLRSINEPTELEMTSDVLQNGKRARYVKLLEVRVTSSNQKIQSSNLPKWHCTLWRNINSHIIVGHRTSFQAVCRYVNCHRGSLDLRVGHTLRLSYALLTMLQNKNWPIDSPQKMSCSRTSFVGPSIVFTCPSCLCKSLSPSPSPIIGQ